MKRHPVRFAAPVSEGQRNELIWLPVAEALMTPQSEESAVEPFKSTLTAPPPPHRSLMEKFIALKIWFCSR